MIQLLLGISGMLIGLTVMRLSLTHLFRARLSMYLARVTDSSIAGFLLGIGCAVLFQGSSAVTLLTIGLVSGGILTFPQSIAILLGANVGTCSTVPLLLSLPSHTITDFIPHLMLLSFPLLFLRRLRPLIGAVCGISLMLIGFDTLHEASSRLLQQSDLLALIDYADHTAWLAILSGTLLTFAMQSASGSTLFLTSLSEEGLLASKTACYLIYGNNIGSCLSSVLVSSAAPREGKMTALANLLLNLGGTLIFLPLTDTLIDLATCLDLTTADRLVFYHTVFNLISALLLLPFIEPYAHFIEWICRRKKA